MCVIRAESLAVMDLWPENDPIVDPTCGPRDAAAGRRCTNEDLMDYYDQSRVSVSVSLFVPVPVETEWVWPIVFSMLMDGPGLQVYLHTNPHPHIKQNVEEGLFTVTQTAIPD